MPTFLGRGQGRQKWAPHLSQERRQTLTSSLVRCGSDSRCPWVAERRPRGEHLWPIPWASGRENCSTISMNLPPHLTSPKRPRLQGWECRLFLRGPVSGDGTVLGQRQAVLQLRGGGHLSGGSCLSPAPKLLSAAPSDLPGGLVSLE